MNSNQSINQSNYFIVRLKVDQLSLPHLGMTKTEKIELQRKTDEQISPVNGLEPWDQSDRQEQTKVEDKIFWKGTFWAQSETVKKWWKVIAMCSKLNRHVQMKIAGRGWVFRMRNSEWCRKLVPKMRWSMSEGSMSDLSDDQSNIRWRACVVAMRRLNRYEVIEIQWLSGIENFVREMILYSIRSKTLSQWTDFRIWVMCWNFGAGTTVRSRVFWMCWRRFIWYFERP